jgi:hypothetical protein
MQQVNLIVNFWHWFALNATQLFDSLVHTQDEQLSSGRITLSPQTNAKGFRWIDRPSSTLWAARIGGFPCKINHLRVIF